eukprot:4825472-Pyramimonas_sp.AAC.1
MVAGVPQHPARSRPPPCLLAPPGHGIALRRRHSPLSWSGKPPSPDHIALAPSTFRESAEW